jgi:hypothetical protein
VIEREVTELNLNAPAGEVLASAAYLSVLAYPESYCKRPQGEILGTGQKGMLPRIYRRNTAARAAQRMISSGCSLNEVARIYGGNDSYFLHTVWAESKPVLHLALGLRSVLVDWQDDGRAPYVQLLARQGWVREAMTQAENWRRLLTIGAGAESTREFMRHIDPDAFIQLVPVECADSPTTPKPHLSSTPRARHYVYAKPRSRVCLNSSP